MLLLYTVAVAGSGGAFNGKRREIRFGVNDLMQKHYYEPHYAVPQQVKCALKRKRLIFTITTGRSGTGYLAEMLRFVPGILSCHEPEPKFSHIMRSAQTNPEVAYNFWIRKKLPAIVGKNAPIYIETSHLFCKGFIEPLIHLGIRPDVIILTRPWREVAKSLYELNIIPGRTPDGLKFLVSPEDPEVLPLPCWKKLHDYQLCFWYCLEINRRIEIYKQLLLKKNVRIAEISFYEIITTQGMGRLLAELDLPKPDVSAWQAYLVNHQNRINTKFQIKANNAKETIQDMDYLEQEVLRTTRVAFAHEHIV